MINFYLFSAVYATTRYRLQGAVMINFYLFSAVYATTRYRLQGAVLMLNPC